MRGQNKTGCVGGRKNRGFRLLEHFFTIAFIKTIFQKLKSYPCALILSKGDFPFMVRPFVKLRTHHERASMHVECGYEI
jgi:hypothetical protein